MKEKKRKFTRIHFERQANLDFFPNKYDNSQIIDLNLTGMFIFGDFQQHVGERCLVTLLQQGSSSTMSLQAAAKVVRLTDEGVAIEFVSMTFDSYMFLQTTLLYECDEPCGIALEIPEHCPFEIIDDMSLLSDTYPPPDAVSQ